MITSVRKIPAASYDDIFMAAGRLAKLEEKGYVEEEYFFDGTANVYERTADGGKDIRFADAPYTSRFLVRKPARKEDFSGNIVIEIDNATPGFDLDRSWILTYKEIVRSGDIYIGLLSKPNVLAALNRFDEARYGSLSWKNPLTYEKSAEEEGLLRNDPASETGLFWDILMDTARLLKSDSELNPLAEYIRYCKDDKEEAGTEQVRPETNPPASGKIKTILMGWSQSGGYMLRYMKDFATQEGNDCFDGYFAMGGAGSAVPQLNQEDPRDPAEDLHPYNTDRPFIDMHTESDNAKIGSVNTRLHDSEFYRIYDIAGPSHDTWYSEEEYYAEDTALKRLGRLMQYRGADPHPNNFPSQLAFQAALRYLKDWIREGKAPITVAEMPFDKETLENIKDADGNSLSGWRLPEITLPVCAYYGNSTAALSPDDTFTPMVYGREEPFPKEEIVRRYETLANYRKLVEAEADACIEKGLLLKEDREDCIERAVLKAQKYGLE